MPDIQVEEFYLKGTLDLGSLAAMMTPDNKFQHRSRAGTGDARPHYESLQARLKAQQTNNPAENFCLTISESSLRSDGIPEGAAGRIRRSILSEGGILQVFYVKVLEKGDTYEVSEVSFSAVILFYLIVSHVDICNAADYRTWFTQKAKGEERPFCY